jgi:hypothetical protein
MGNDFAGSVHAPAKIFCQLDFESSKIAGSVNKIPGWVGTFGRNYNLLQVPGGNLNDEHHGHNRNKQQCK